MILEQDLNVEIVIASKERPSVLEGALPDLVKKASLAKRIILVVTDESDLPENLPERVDVVYSSTGLTVQRNRGIECLSDDADIVVFLDDDTLISESYIANLEDVFQSDENIVGVEGDVVRDGLVDFDQAFLILDASELGDGDGDLQLVKSNSLYGCNFAVTRNAALATMFDERLVLYGWLEDADFSHRLKAEGDIVSCGKMKCIHLRVPSGGRVNHERFGFSQVMNSWYLKKKNNLSLYSVMRNHIVPVLTSNVLRSVIGLGQSGWRRRLKGNVLAMRMIFSGIVEPEHAQNL